MPGKINLKLNIIAALTAASGFITLSSTLLALSHSHKIRIVLADAHLTVIAGLSLIYLAALLRRGKHNAWLISFPVYALLMIRNFRHFIIDFHQDELWVWTLLNLVIPLITLLLLLIYNTEFGVRSEIRSFALAARRSAIILLVAFLYGIFGFSIMDEHDFHQELSIASAAHYTVDQFGLTTNQHITAYTKRANIFVDSLGLVSFTAVAYTAISFFAPIRFRLRHNQQDLADTDIILKKHGVTSEDFFKLWPRDKAYFFSAENKAVIAYHVVNNVALCVGDPVGPKDKIEPLVKDFLEYCRINDWAVSFVHTDDTNLKLFESLDFNIQKIGEEAIIDIGHFDENVSANKYFRHINNKFTKQGYHFEVHAPPHSRDLISTLRYISDDWLQTPGRSEYGFMMGYFNEEYMQSCNVVVVRDGEGAIQAFLNQVPSYGAEEANYDFLRQRRSSQSNINDYLMISFMHHLKALGFKRLNMGLSPLTGLGPDKSKNRTAVDNLLHLVYLYADRFYSFQGLARFKSKYEPQWESRYIIYRGGIPGLTRTMNALLKAMRK